MLAVNANFIAHFPEVSEALKQYVIDVALVDSRYLFVRSEKKAQIAFCSHCHEEYTVSGQAHKHNEQAACEKCRVGVVVKSHGMGRKHLVDEAYIIWYDKSLVDPNAIVATWYLAKRDYHGDYRQVETTFQPRARYLFEPGRGGTMFRQWERWDWKSNTIYREWANQKNISPLPAMTGGGFFQPRTLSYVSYGSIETAVTGTYFAYLPWREFGEDWMNELNSWSLIEYFALAAKYPCVEYLSKMGLKKLVAAKMNGQATYGAINWRGKSIDKVLKLDKQALRELREVAANMTPLTLHSFHYWRKAGLEIDFRAAQKLEGLVDGEYYKKIVDELSEKTNANQLEIVKYLIKQASRPDAPFRYTSVTTVLGEWRDYLNECDELGINTKQEHVLFPNNLQSAHDKTMRKIKLKRDERLNEIIVKRVMELEQYILENEQFLIRPAKDSMELFMEGRLLQHCVGGYADRYAKGGTEIYFVRMVNAPEDPFVTVEVVNGKLVQARGLKNSPSHLLSPTRLHTDPNSRSHTRRWVRRSVL